MADKLPGDSKAFLSLFDGNRPNAAWHAQQAAWHAMQAAWHARQAVEPIVEPASAIPHADSDDTEPEDWREGH